MPKMSPSSYDVEDFIEKGEPSSTTFNFVERKQRDTYDTLLRHRRHYAVRAWIEQKELWLNAGKKSAILSRIRPRFEIVGEKVFLYPFPNLRTRAIEVADKNQVAQVIDDLILKFKRKEFDEQLLIEEKLPKDPW
jgi:hypothetical protein